MTDEAKALVERLRGDWPEILVEKHWMMDSDAIDKQREEAADLIETQAREIERLREALQREEYGHCKSIEERDYAEEYISRIYRTVTGKTAEWSNLFGFAEALDDIRAALAGDSHDQ